MSLSTQNNTPQESRSSRRARSIRLRELILFAMLGAIMFSSRVLMAALPNIHIVGMLTVLYTVVFRWKALIPLYIYVLAEGVFAGFDVWWLPYLYIWTLLWGATMLLPQKMPRGVACVIYPLLCGVHGLLFGVLYAPVWALVYRMNLAQALAWIAAGTTFDILHCVGDVSAGLLILPLAEIFRKALKKLYT